jgi:hypothetical protein
MKATSPPTPRRASTFLIALMGGLLTSMVLTTSALAAAVHIPGKKIEFLDIGTQLMTLLKLAGLGNGDVTILISAEGTADVDVINPGGNNPPGQQVPVVASGSETVPSDQIKNGTVFVSLTTDEIDEDELDVELPNPNWSIDITDVVFEEATVTVVQNGVVVFQATYEL